MHNVKFGRLFYEPKSEKNELYKPDQRISNSLLYVWYLYNFQNQNAFVVGVPFTETVIALVYELNDLYLNFRTFLSKPKNLLRIYLFPHNDKRSDNLWP